VTELSREIGDIDKWFSNDEEFRENIFRDKYKEITNRE
jgi:hypothetical protein